jgi:hypothetical protein
VNTNNYGGREINKRITVQTNDKNNPRLFLTIKGNVERIYTMNPNRIVLTGTAGDVIKGSATLFPMEKYPFKILDANIEQVNVITFSWKPYESNTGTGYLLTATNIKKDAGRYSAKVILKTDSNILPEIPIYVYGNILEPKPR